MGTNTGQLTLVTYPAHQLFTYTPDYLLTNASQLFIYTAHQLDKHQNDFFLIYTYSACYLCCILDLASFNASLLVINTGYDFIYTYMFSVLKKHTQKKTSIRQFAYPKLTLTLSNQPINASLHCLLASYECQLAIYIHGTLAIQICHMAASQTFISIQICMLASY